MLKRLGFFGLLPLFFCGLLAAAEKTVLTIEGDYIAYSYDYNQVYGENVRFDFSGYAVISRFIKIDLGARIFYAYGEVTLTGEEEILTGQELLFNPLDGRGTLLRYEETIEKTVLGEAAEAEPQPEVPPEVSLEKLRKSFIYFTCRKTEVSEDMDVVGFGVTMHLEGLESFGFKKFKMSEGFRQRKKGFALDKIWFTRSQGIIARGSYLYERKNKINSLTQISYEERSVLKEFVGPERQMDVMTSTSYTANEKTNFSLTGNYNTTNLWNANFLVNRRWGKLNTSFDVAYNKPINFEGETWFGLQTALDGGKYGNLSAAARYELQDQIMGNFSYGNTFFNHMTLMMNSTYSRVKITGSQDYSEILSGGLSLGYGAKIFNLSTDYYLNYDLFGSQLLSQPQLRLAVNPFRIYGGLLTLSLNNIFIYNHLRREDEKEYSYSNNTSLSLTTQPIFVRKSLHVNFTLSAEQFLEKENRNFTSGGFIVNASQMLVKGFFLEGFYSSQSRRKSEGWLIEGTTSQDLSLVFRVTPNKKINSWVSVSYDPKNRQWRQTFADLSIEVIKNWKFHSLLNYDFLMKRMNNVDLYLIREAGRFQIRFIWRSLSKQFLVELTPL